jgi:hypothetical protein
MYACLFELKRLLLLYTHGEPWPNRSNGLSVWPLGPTAVPFIFDKLIASNNAREV